MGMAGPDCKAIRNALAGAVGEIEAMKVAHAAYMAEMRAVHRRQEENEGLRRENVEQAGRISELEAQLARHEGPHNPSSHRSAANDRRAAARREARRGRAAEGPPGSGGATGRRPGHPGGSHDRETEEKVIHSLERYYNCDSDGLR